MPRPAITPEKKAAMRKQIREATSRVVQRMNFAPGDVSGYERITIREVAKEAGISVGTFYKYFESREDLGQSLWSEPVAKLQREIQADVDKSESPSETIRILLNHYVRFSVENRRVFRAAFLFVRPDNHPARDTVKLEDEMFYQNLRAAFTEGQASGEFKEFDTHQMAQTFWAGIHGALGLPENLDRYTFDEPTDMAAHMIESLMTMITE